MNGNIGNGGLLVSFRRREIMSDFTKHWYMNADDENVYYSDVSQNNYLFRMNGDDPEGSVILKKPCVNVTLCGDWIYYINEDDKWLYRCLRSGRSESLITKEEVSEFIVISKDNIVYAPMEGGIKSISHTLLERDKKVTRLCAAGGKLFYADCTNGGYLSCVEISAKSGEARVFDNVIPTHINGDETYIYFTNALEGNTIFKMNISNGQYVRICGESAEYPHLIDNKLFFWDGVKWKRVFLDGGGAEDII